MLIKKASQPFSLSLCLTFLIAIDVRGQKRIPWESAGDLWLPLCTMLTGRQLPLCRTEAPRRVQTTQGSLQGPQLELSIRWREKS